MRDHELVQKIHSGNKEALSIVVERYYTDIFRFCLYMIQSEEEAYDLTQETFLKFIKYGTSYQQNNLKGYLLTVARNLCFNYFRERKSMCDLEELDKMVANEKHLSKVEDFIYLKKLLGELSQDIREVIILRTYEEMKFKDIAKIMGCGISTAKSRYRLGIKQLKRMMENDYGKPRY